MMITPTGIEVMTIGALVGLVTSLLNKKLINRDRMEEIQKQTKEYQKQLKEAQKEKNTKKMEEINKKMMPLMTEQMKMSFKPMMYTFVPIILLFTWLGSKYGQLGVLANIPLILKTEWGWLGLYILSTLIVTLTIEAIHKQYRKAKKKK